MNRTLLSLFFASFFLMTSDNNHNNLPRTTLTASGNPPLFTQTTTYQNGYQITSISTMATLEI